MKVQKALFLFALLATSLACSLSTPPEQDVGISIPLATQSDVKSEISGAASPAPEKENLTLQEPETCLVSAQALNLRDCAGITCHVISWLHAEDKLVILETGKEWLKVKTQDGQTGWVNGKYCGGQP